MTIVPKKKPDSRSSNNNNANKANASTGPGAGSKEQIQDELHQDQEQQLKHQQQHQQRRSPLMQCSSSWGDHADEEDTNYQGYDVNTGNELGHDRRHRHNNKYNNSRGDDESNINHVVLITVLNPHYPITCDLVHQICSTYGKVNRIVIFKKNGVQAMVEFDNVEGAKKARAMLHGCDIYSGCCTLKIEFAKPVRLNVHRNNSVSFDYTNPNLASGPANHNATSDTNSNDNQQQPNHNHHHHHQQHHHLQQSSSGTGHGPYMQGANAHHGRSSGIGRRGGSGGLVDSIGGETMNGPHGDASGHNQFHPNSHMHAGNHQHSKQNTIQSTMGDQPGNLHQPTNYAMGQPIDQSGVSAESSDQLQHQDSGFNVGRNANSNANVGPHQPNFVAMDAFMPTSANQSAHLSPHAMHGNMYPCQYGHHHQQSHLQSHHRSHHIHPRGGLSGGPGRGHNHHNSSFPPQSGSGALMSGASHLTPQGTVLMIYGLNVDRVNCDRLFNLFCLYGNVVRVKFLKSKEGCAMVQMGDVIAIDRCFSSLNKITLFGNELQVSYSKQPFLHDVLLPFTLPDGTPSFKDFTSNKNNRFRNPEVASKNRILAPSRVLHFFNAPFGISDDELMLLFKQTAGYEPVSLKIFTPKADNAKSYSGLLTFRDPAEATEALVLCNHLSLPKAGVQHPYVLRLCFSPPTLYC